MVAFHEVPGEPHPSLRLRSRLDRRPCSGRSGSLSVAAVRKGVSESSIPAYLKKVLLGLAADGAVRLDEVWEAIGKWFDTRNGRGIAPLRTQQPMGLLLISLLVVVGFNVDAIGATHKLYHDDATRAVITQQAFGIVETCEASHENSGDVLDGAQNEIEAIEGETDFPVGWTEDSQLDFWHVVGWLLPACAIGQGAPFWFDLLRKVSGIRN